MRRLRNFSDMKIIIFGEIDLTCHNLSISSVKISKFHFLYTKKRWILFKVHLSLVDLFRCITPRYTWNEIIMSVSYLYSKQGCVRFTNSVSVALEKSLFLIYIIRCCDDSIVNSNVNKPNAAFKGRTRSQTRNFWGTITLFRQNW